MELLKKQKKTNNNMKKTIKKAQSGAKSDSLMKESIRKKSFSGAQERIANSQKKYIGKPIESLLKSPGWGAIQNLFKTHKEAEIFQDEVGKFIAEAIN